MRTVEVLDFKNPQHRGVLFDLAMAHKDHLLNDHENDIVVIINSYDYRASVGETHAFLAVIDGEPAGCFWIETDRGIGRVRGALLPEFKTAWNTLYFLKWLVSFGFEILELRKLDAEMALYSKKDRGSATSERLLKRIGFQKRAILPEALMIDGKPKDTILLDYLKRDYDVKV